MARTGTRAALIRWRSLRWLLGIAPCIPGFIATVSAGFKEAIPALWVHLYHYAWFISFGVSFVVYVRADEGDF